MHFLRHAFMTKAVGLHLPATSMATCWSVARSQHQSYQRARFLAARPAQRSASMAPMAAISRLSAFEKRIQCWVRPCGSTTNRATSPITRWQYRVMERLQFFTPTAPRVRTWYRLQPRTMARRTFQLGLTSEVTLTDLQDSSSPERYRGRISPQHVF